MRADVVVVGGGVAGSAVVMAAKTLYPDRTVLMVRREQRAIVPCGLPYTVATMSSAEQDAKSDEGMKKRGIGVRQAGIALENGMIKVDAYMRAEAEGVFAAALQAATQF